MFYSYVIDYLAWHFWSLLKPDVKLGCITS